MHLSFGWELMVIIIIMMQLLVDQQRCIKVLVGTCRTSLSSGVLDWSGHCSAVTNQVAIAGLMLAVITPYEQIQREAACLRSLKLLQVSRAFKSWAPIVCI
jgi:hypothetical protein